MLKYIQIITFLLVFVNLSGQKIITSKKHSIWDGKKFFMVDTLLVIHDSSNVEMKIMYDDTIHQLITYKYHNDSLIKQGLFITYGRNHKIFETCNFTNGYINGKFFIYYHNGNICQITDYKNGIVDGYDCGFYSNGKTSYKGKYSKGYKVGLWKYYYENGNIQAKGRFYKTYEKDTFKIINLDTCYSRNFYISTPNPKVFDYETEYQPRKGTWYIYNCEGKLIKKYKFSRKKT